MSAVLLRRAGRRSLSVASQLLSAQRSMACRASLPAAAEAVASAVSPHCPVVVSGARQQPVPLGGTRGFAAGSGLAGGAFVIRRVPQAAAVPSLPASSDGSPGGSLSGARCVAVAAAPQPPSPGRRLATSATPFCNLAAGGGLSDFDEAPFGHAPSFAASAAGMTSADASESESEDDDVAVAQVGGSILYGVPRMGRASRSTRKPVAEMEARWIGSASHSGDWSRASTVKPVAESGSTVWAQILGACREDPAQLKSTVAMLHAAFQQSQMVPPLPAFNKLLQLCSKQPDAMETVHQLVAMMSGSALKPNEETHKQMEACFAYNNPQRAS